MEDLKMDNKKMCLHQFIRPNSEIKVPSPPGYGNCSICITDPNNKNCKGYCPITVSFVDVKK